MSPLYRLAVMADIHGNLPAFEAVMVDLEKFSPLDGILVAGDIIGGPDQAAVLRRLKDLGAVMIQGNNEQAVVRIAAGQAPEYFYTTQQFSLRRWAREHLTAEEIGWISGLPEQQVIVLPGAPPMRMMHGSPTDINELVVSAHCQISIERILQYIPSFNPFRLDEIFQSASETVLIFGHTHLPWEERSNGHLGFNPGAVSFPENGFVGAQYALLNWDGSQWTPEFHAIAYDMDALARSFEESGFLSAGPLAKIFLKEMLCGKDILPGFFALAKRLAQEAGYENLPYFPDDIWEQAGRMFEELS